MNQIFRFLYLSLAAIVPTLLVAQNKVVRVVDDSTRVGISYATIYFPGGSGGLITDEDGYAVFSMADQRAPDSIVVSCLNYSDRRMVIGDLDMDRDTVPIELVKQDYFIPTIGVSASRIELKGKKLGDRRRPINAKYDLTTQPPPGEIGKIIKVQRKSLVDSLTVYIDEMEIDSFLLEVNIYDFALGWPGRKLQSSRIIHRVSRVAAGGPYTIDLTGQRITIHDDVLITLQGLRYTDKGKAGGALLLAARVGNGKGMEREPNGSWTDTYLSPAVTVFTRY